MFFEAAPGGGVTGLAPFKPAPPTRGLCNITQAGRLACIIDGRGDAGGGGDEGGDDWW